MLIAMLIPTHDLLLRLYIGELRGRNISTIETQKIWPSDVGKYSSTMEHLGMEISLVFFLVT